MKTTQLFNLYKNEMLLKSAWREKDIILNHTNVNYIDKYNMLVITRILTPKEQAQEHLKAIHCDYRIDWHRFV